MTAAPPLQGTDFAAAIRRNKDNTLLLLEVLAVTTAVFGFMLGWATGILRDIWALPPAQLAHLTIGWVLHDLARLPPRPEAFIGCIAMVTVGTAWGVTTLYLGGQILSAFVGARPADPKNQFERRFLDVIEEMAIAAGLPLPRAMVVDTPALNAFASGSSPNRAIITATAGLLQTCTRDELQGVVGHEMGHVADYDVRYATVVAAVAGVAVLASHLLWDAGRWPWALRGKGAGGTARGGLTLVVLLALAVVAIAAPLAARLVQFAISRQREYLADATSVKLTRNPIGLISALQRLQRSDTSLARADSPVAALCIAAPGHDATEALFSSHPPLEERIARLQNLGAAMPTKGST
jgi:heat shock protein HtpX